MKDDEVNGFSVEQNRPGCPQREEPGGGGRKLATKERIAARNVLRLFIVLRENDFFQLENKLKNYDVGNFLRKKKKN